MPRVVLIKKKYDLGRLQGYIRNEMKRKGVSQEYVAKQLGIEQASFSHLLKTMRFRLDQIVVVFNVLDTDEKQIGELIYESYRNGNKVSTKA